MAVPPRDPTRTTFLVLVLGGLSLGSFYIFEPFLPATIWAATIVVATWPLLRRLQAALWRSRALAVAVTTVLILLGFVAPFWLAIATLVARAPELEGLAQSAAEFRAPAVPQWVQDLPLVGAGLAETWGRIESAGLGALASGFAPYGGRLTHWIVELLGGFSLLLVEFLLTVVIAAIIHARGEAAGALVLRFGQRLAGDRGRQMVMLAGDAVRAVAVGVMVTAVVETAIGGLGLALAGMPLPAVLSAVMFVVCLAQAGPGVVLIPAVIWMYAFRGAGAASLLLAISLLAIVVDNVLRPFLIRKEAQLPMLLVLVGVIGGLAAFGLVGIFVGPAVLAVSYTLLRAWLTEES